MTLTERFRDPVWANVGTHFGAWQGSRAEVESATNPPQADPLA